MSSLASSQSTARKWAVVGAGPCGIAVVGRLVDLGHRVTWIDPTFQVGRMGPFYRNVPANTLNGDLVYAARLCSSFKFEENQQKRRVKGQIVMEDLPPDQCFELGYLTDFLEDCTVELKNRVQVIQGYLVHLKKESITAPTWSFEAISTVADVENEKSHHHTGEVHGVINVCGCGPVSIPSLPSISGNQTPITIDIHFENSSRCITFHSLDLAVDPQYMKYSFLDKISNTNSSHWVVIGSSHSGMLVVKNLVEAGIRNVTVIHRSPLKFMTLKNNGCKKYQGTGLKGPVGDWVSMQIDQKNPAFQMISYDGNKSWEEQLMQIDADHVVSAIGFSRVDTGSVENSQNEYVSDQSIRISIEENRLHIADYDRWSGEIMLHSENNPVDVLRNVGIFGGGIAFPQNHRDEEGDIEPWVGFKRSIEQTDLMLESYESHLN